MTWTRLTAAAVGLLLWAWGLSAPLTAQQSPRAGAPTPGVIAGKILSAGTQQPIAGAAVAVKETGRGGVTDSAGAFSIPGVPPGSHTLEVRHVGYHSGAVPDVIVRPARTTSLQVELEPAAMELEGITIVPTLFRRSEEQPTSTIRFSAEEIRRAPGSAGDISRIILGLPSLAKVNDQYNGLAVRGGSPAENLFLVDNIAIPNLNHFPTQGSSGGAIGLLNVDLVRDVQFQAGGFAAPYGGRLSSVMEIALREGNREEIDGQVDLNFAGFGGVAEGPLPGAGSWLVSARRSYIDLLVKTMDLGTTIAPRYGDAQAKLTYDLGLNHQLTTLGIWSDDHIHSDLETALDNDMQVYGRQDLTQSTLGMNWRALWSAATYSNTSISVGTSRYDEDFIETATGTRLLDNRSRERVLRFRTVSHSLLGGSTALRFGVEAEHMIGDYENRYAAHDDPLGTIVPALELDERLTGEVAGAFMSVGPVPVGRLSTTVGIRADYFGLGQRLHFAPRLGLSYRLAEATSLSASAGLYYQQLPLVLLAQRPENQDLATPEATHWVVRMQHLLARDTRFTIEAYRKQYRHLPLDPDRPALFVLDEPVAGNGFFDAHARLTDEGRARATGVEATLQKRLAERVYGLVSAAYFRTRYRDGNGIWRNRVYDNRILLAAEGGYRPCGNWELSARWIYAGGTPYTSIDMAASAEQGRTVLDDGRVNAVRYPDYHSLNLRLDRRFHFRRSNLTAYISVWNAYNRRNVASYFWNPQTTEIDTILQWGTLPIFGLEYEF